MRVFPPGDYTALLNSAAWGALSVLSLYLVADRVYGRRVALIAAALLAIAPMHVEHSRLVRQYAFLTTLLPWAWYFSRDQLLRSEPSRATLARMIVSALLVVYTLGTGLMHAAFIGLYGLGAILQHRVPWPRARSWLEGQAVIVAIALPAAVNGLVRSHSSHLAVPDTSAFLSIGADLLGGVFLQSSVGLAALFYALVVGVTIRAVLRPEGRVMILVFVPLVLVFVTLISLGVRPIWHRRQFLFALPFMCMALALLVDWALGASPRKAALGYGATLGGAAIMGYGAFLEVTAHDRPPTHRLALEYIEGELERGDVIWVPHTSDYWGVAWYFHGPGWGSPVAVQDRILEQAAPNKWGKILKRLGPEWSRRLLLAPEQPFIEKEGVRLYIGYGSGPEIASLRPKRVYTLHFPQIGSHDRPIPSPPGYEEDSSGRRWFRPSKAFVGIEVRLFRPVERDQRSD
jgi:hypothetical protein